MKGQNITVKKNIQIEVYARLYVLKNYLINYLLKVLRLKMMDATKVKFKGLL